MSAPLDASRPIEPAALAAAIGWLADGARSAVRSQDVLEQLCLRLVGSGLPLWRVAVFVRTLHPLLMGRSFVWRPDREVEVSEAPFQLLDDTLFLTSPVQKIYLTDEAIRRRLADPDCPTISRSRRIARRPRDRLSRIAAELHERRNPCRDLHDATGSRLL